jgi:hypothetical protein
LGLAEYRNGLWDGAIATLEKSIEMSKGTDPTDFFFLAMAHWQRGDRNDAERVFQRAVEAARKDAPAQWEWRMIWAEAAERLGNPARDPTAYEAPADPDRAMASLRRAVATGGVDLAGLRTDPDLAPLRDRPDFQLLIMDLAMPAEPFCSVD